MADYLSKSIVIRNEYTVKGSRGKTPGNYVTQYMSRTDAVETLLPRKNDTDTPMDIYSRRDVYAKDSKSYRAIRSSIRKLQGAGGVAFSDGNVSLSNDELYDASVRLQKAYEDGRPVMKTVISFDQDYLKQSGIVDDDFELYEKGDYRGRADHLKLRMAVMNGLSGIPRYSDLHYVGTLQVDTKHVHCHLAMVDMGVKEYGDNKVQHGLIDNNTKYMIRQGIDEFFKEHLYVRNMTSNYELDRRNAISFIKKYTHDKIRQRGTAQFLYSCLPDDKRLWRASSKDPAMQKANAVARNYVMDVFRMRGSGYKEALRRVEEKVKETADKKNLSGEQYEELIKKGQERLITSGINSVYNVLAKMPEDELVKASPVLSSMALELDDMRTVADDDPMIGFGIKLRSYKQRLDKHKSEKTKYREAHKGSENQEIDETAKPFVDFLKLEEEYNDMLACKYRHFLYFLPAWEDEKEYSDIKKRGSIIKKYKAMLDDDSFRILDSVSGEAYGKVAYGIDKGGMLSVNRKNFEKMISRQEKIYAEKKEAYKSRMQDDGFTLNENDDVVKYEQYSFGEVKYLDLHHLQHDFPRDFRIPENGRRIFSEMADRRYGAFVRARDYLVGSGQEKFVKLLPVDDIMKQHELADKLRVSDSFETEPYTIDVPAAEVRQKMDSKKTISLDYGGFDALQDEMEEAVNQSADDFEK